MDYELSVTGFLSFFRRSLAMTYQLLAMGLITIAITSCTGGPTMNQQKNMLPSIKEIPAEAWHKLSQKKVYFGHQSVGYDIINGIKEIMKENPQVKLNITGTKKAADFTVPIFAHSEVGKNEDPASKIDDFVSIIGKGLGGEVQIAFFKFCFVDVVSGTDINRLFDEYRSKLATLKEKYPDVIFVHWTVPLMTVQTGPKAFIKKIIGKTIGGYSDNIRREQYNAMLRKEYEDKEPVFDLAAIESTNPDGSRLSFSQNGSIGYALVPKYTSDGGHLNKKGCTFVAEQLLILLANLASR